MSGFREPSFDLVYGPSKIGKTTDTLYSCPNAYFIAPPGALKPSVNVVGFDVPAEHCFDAKNIPDAVQRMQEIGGKRCPHCGVVFREVVVDDFSLLAELSLSLLSTRLSGWDLWGALQNQVLSFRDTGRRFGQHLIMNCHETGPKMVQGLSQRGGPKLPGKLPEALPAGCDLVLRGTAGAATFGGKLGWAGVYRCNPNDSGFVSGDRHGVTPDMSPMNLGEILRAAGYTIARAPGMEWMDKAVDTVTHVLLGSDAAHDGSNMTEATKWLAGNLITIEPYKSDTDPMRTRLALHIRWVLRDAYDRALLTRSRANPLALFGVK